MNRPFGGTIDGKPHMFSRELQSDSNHSWDVTVRGPWFH